MNNSTLYEAMYHRCSVRKYSPHPLDTEVLRDLEAFLAEVEPLHPDARAAVQLLGPTQVNRAITAPHYAAVYTADDRLSQLTGGYLLQYLALYLADRELGCCYNGMAKPHAGCLQYEGLDYAMTLAFGNPMTPQRRTGMGAFKRREISEIATPQVPAWLAESVRVAPSAMNVQPWYLSAVGERIEVYYAPKGLMSRVSSGTKYIDLGIALAHIRIAAEQRGIPARFLFEAEPTANLKGRHEMICAVALG